MAAKYSSPDDDEDTRSSHNDVSLCVRDQANPCLCPSLSCSNLHMCRDYLLTNRCSEFETNGKCSHSHSLFTLHNQKILKKLKLSIKDRETFDKISRLVRTSENKSSRVEGSSIPDDDSGVTFRSKEIMKTGRGRGWAPLSSPPPGPSLSTRMSLDNQSTATPTRLSISSRLSSLTNSHSSRDMFSKSMDFSSNPRGLMARRSIDLIDNQFGQQEDDEQNPDIIHSSSVLKEKEQNNHSSSLDHVDETKEGSSFFSTFYRHGKSIATGVLDLVGKKKEKDPTKSDPNDVVTSDSQLKYVFNKYSKDDQLSYLLGPIRRYLIDKGYNIFPSGYCQLANMDQEKDIEQRLRTAVFSTLQIDRIHLPNDDLAFFSSTSAAERIFEQTQLTYSIISEPYTASFSIEVINAAKDDRTRSRSLPSRKILHARLPAERDTPPPSISEGKFRIPTTNSSIGVTCGDITEANVDLMVCVSTSQTLLHSVLAKAGPLIRSQYDQPSRSRNTVLLDGGFTAARKILFIPWKLEVNPSNSMQAQDSLSDLVKRCIQRALELNMTSIAFPSIGTGQIGLDPNKVCKSMIGAASERLHLYKMDVLFVIYPSSESEKKSYQIFCTYLDDLCNHSRSIRVETPAVTYVPHSSASPVQRSQQIHRSVECKHISTVSNSSDMAFDHRQLVKSLEQMIEERTFDIALVQQLFIDKIELLIDACLDYHVLPRIDFVKGDLILRGDRDSCSQCFANLQKRRSIHKYNVHKKTGGKDDEIKLNMYVSIKIDEAFTNDESNTRIQDDTETIFRVDLKAWQIQINDDVRTFGLYTEPLNDSKTVLPKSWSSTLMIRTVEVERSSYKSMECVHAFEHTMSRSEWRIERIDAIENWPVYLHYNNKKIKDETIAFHGCSFSSVQSIIHYGLHSNHNRSPGNSIHITYDALNSHIRNTRRSTDGKHYMFVLQLSKKLFNQDSANLTNENAHLALPTYLIVYRRETIA